MSLPKNKKYLVSGGSGFIGSALVRRLVETGVQVRVLDNHHRGAMRRLEGLENRIEVFEGDIRDSQTVKRAATGCNSLIHLAYLNGTEFFYTKPQLVLDIGVKGMINMLDAALELDIKEFTLASSSEVYQQPAEIPTPETVPLIVPDVLNPRYSYGAGKIISEVMAINYGRNHFERMMIFRPHNVYGPDMGWEHVIPQMILRACDSIAATETKRVPFSIQGEGRETRAFIFIDDFIDGIMAILENGKHNEIYHVGTEEEISIASLATAILHHFGREPEFIKTPLTQGSVARRCPKIDKLRSLGFKPTRSLEQGLARTIDWYAKHRDLCPSSSYQLK
jgi:nucleoside-diphosphate-sugar epimerase